MSVYPIIPMKRRKYLNPPIWPYVLFLMMMVMSRWEGMQTSSIDRAISLGIFAMGSLGVLWWGGRSLIRALKAETQFRTGHILCPYWIYILDKHAWSQWCPECSVFHTREDVYNYWKPHISVNKAFGYDPDQS